MGRQEGPPPPSHLPPYEITREELSSQQVKIQLALFITFLLYIAVMMLGRARSRGSSWMKLLSGLFFLVAGKIINYIPGQMSGLGSKNDLYIFWISSMAYLYAVTHEISCYTLEENGGRKKTLLVDFSVVWGLILASLYNALAAPEILVPIVLLFWVVVLKFRERRQALMFADQSSNGFSQAAKIISDFTKYQKNQVDGSVGRFLVGVREAQQMAADEKFQTNINAGFYSIKKIIITLGNVVDSKDGLFTRRGNKLKKTCISFAMFWTLLAKMGGYVGNDNDFEIFDEKDELLAPSFDLVEAELDFLYEFIFTNSYAIYLRGFWRKFRDLIVISLFWWLSMPLFIEYQSQDHNLLFIYVKRRVLDTGLTRSLILVILIIEFTLIGMFVTSKWAKVMYACAYLENEMRERKSSSFIRFINIVGSGIPRLTLPSWLTPMSRRKIGQYSIWKCYSRIPIPFWAKCWIGEFMDVPKIGQAGETQIDLKQHHKTWIIESMKRHGRKFTSGAGSLRTNKAEDLINGFVDVTDKEPQAHGILVWHMATARLAPPQPHPLLTINDGSEEYYFQIATTFSNYCAYLVAFHPQVLPDHVYTTQCEFDGVISVLKGKLLEEEDKKKQTENPEDPEDPEEEDKKKLIIPEKKITEEAKSLEDELIKHHPNLGKILAEFWTEKLLYMALAGHDGVITAHANSLCVGGEFLTLLWALVTHAGCKRIPSTLPEHQGNSPNIERDQISPSHTDMEYM